MATRPVFIADCEAKRVRERFVEFEWIPGMARSQAQKCIRSLHQAAQDMLEVHNILEISNKSEQEEGVALSAFNISLRVEGARRPLECVYQASKVFRDGGPFHDLLEAKPRDAKRDDRLKASGPLKKFQFEDQVWPLSPATAFYDYLYIKALDQNPELSKRLQDFDAFTDIAFNPKKSQSCQARSAALFVVLRSAGTVAEAASYPESFREKHARSFVDPVGPGTLFGSSPS